MSAGDKKVPVTCFMIWSEVNVGSALARLLDKLARIAGRNDIRLAPVNRVGFPVKFNVAGTPGRLGSGLAIAPPEMVCRPEPGGPSSARSLSIMF